MDVPVEAIVDLDCFQDKNAARELLQSFGFNLTDLDGGQVLIEGFYQKLKDVKPRLERLAETTTPTSSSSSPPPRPDSRRRPAPDGGTPGEAMTVDSDAYRYASRFRRRDLDAILAAPGVRADVREGEEDTVITLRGRNSAAALRQLQRLLGELSRSLRTQEVPLRDVGAQGRDLLRKVQENNGALGSVLVCRRDDSLHLVGPSAESHELKRSLQGAPVDQRGARGRSGGPISSRGRSGSLDRRRRDGDGGGPEDAAGRSGAPRGRSQSESRGKQREERMKGRENKDLPVSETHQKTNSLLQAASELWTNMKKRRK